MNYYKVSRHTADVDFLISEEDFPKVRDLLEKAGYRLKIFEKIFTRFISDDFHLMDVDFLFVDGNTLSQIVQEGEKIQIIGKEFIVPSLEHLIALKLHAIRFNPKNRGYRDLPDIIDLIRINKINAKTERFKNLCLKYGTRELYDKILESC